MTRSSAYPRVLARYVRSARSQRTASRVIDLLLEQFQLGPSEFSSVKDPAKLKSKRGDRSLDQQAAPSMCTSLIRVFPAPDSRFSTQQLVSRLKVSRLLQAFPQLQNAAPLSSMRRLELYEICRRSGWERPEAKRGLARSVQYRVARMWHEVLYGPHPLPLKDKIALRGSSPGTPPLPSSSHRGTAASSSRTSRASRALSATNSKRRR
jgi:hypothetical protein